MKKDKKGHLIAGFIIAILSFLALKLFAVDTYIAIYLGFVASTIAGFFKEVYDHYHPKTNTVEFLDFVFTGFGGLIAALFILLISLL